MSLSALNSTLSQSVCNTALVHMRPQSAHSVQRQAVHSLTGDTHLQHNAYMLHSFTVSNNSTYPSPQSLSMYTTCSLVLLSLCCPSILLLCASAHTQQVSTLVLLSVITLSTGAPLLPTIITALHCCYCCCYYYCCPSLL
jgi:hypothetical protein